MKMEDELNGCAPLNYGEAGGGTYVGYGGAGSGSQLGISGAWAAGGGEAGIIVDGARLSAGESIIFRKLLKIEKLLEALSPADTKEG